MANTTNKVLAEEMIARWKNVPKANLHELFKYENTRVRVFQLTAEETEQLLHTPSSQIPNQLRFALGVRSGFVPGGSSPDNEPYIKLIAQSYHADQNNTGAPTKNETAENHFILNDINLMDRVAIPAPLRKMPIPEADAIRMTENWSAASDDDIRDSLEITSPDVQRLLYCVFGKNDIETIQAHIASGSEGVLNVYIGHEPAELPDHPFIFRVVLEANSNTNKYAEVASPCPPLCNIFIG